jgi:GNAT superfamily N-acetyltransferase
MVQIRRAQAREDFEALHGLVALLAAWDMEQMDAMGLPTADLVKLYYSDTVDDLARRFAHARTPALVGRLDGTPVACAALFDAGGRIAEVQKMFVHPKSRGRGVARALMASLLDAAREGGFTLLRLQTVTFMVDAIQLYRTAGFTHCAPFHPVPDSLRAITLFMERRV